MNETPAPFRELPRPFWLNSAYRLLMRLSRRHGMLTLARLNARLFSKGEVFRLPTGNEMYVPPDPHFLGYILARHEHHIYQLMREVIHPGNLCVDVGANIGYFTSIMAALAAPGGIVSAFEPDPANFATLAINAAEARKLNVQVQVTQAAVSNADVPLRLVKGKESTLHTVAAPDAQAGPAELVKSVCLAREFLDLGRAIDFLKIDVEGHELAVLNGCGPLLEAKRVRWMVVEVTPGDCAKEVAALLRRWQPEVKCWLENAWIDSSIETIPYRTDVSCRFQN